MNRKNRMKIKEIRIINKPLLNDHPLRQVPQLMFEYRTCYITGLVLIVYGLV